MVGQAFAQSDYPNQPVRCICMFPPGSGADVLVRFFANKLSKLTGKNFLVENRAGATGTIGAELVAKAPPDGHSLYLASQTTHAVAPYMYAKVGYDPIKDFATVVLVSQNPLLVVVHPSLGVKTMKELVALAKARPGDLNFATGGQGSSPHMSMELLKTMTGIDLVHIPYTGGGLAVTAAIGGQVQLNIGTTVGVLPHVRSGKLRAIAVTTATRSPAAPDVPTFAEQVLPGFEVVQWYGVFTPAGLPPPVLQKINADTNRVLQRADVRDQYEKLGMTPGAMGMEEFGRFVRSEIAKYQKIVKQADIKPL